jgi:hypothetical protein
MISIVTSAEGDIVHVHADKQGLSLLERAVAQLRLSAEKGDCGHEHLFSASWGGRELSETALGEERLAGYRQVHHLKLFGWTDEWARRHELVSTQAPAEPPRPAS